MKLKRLQLTCSAMRSSFTSRMCRLQAEDVALTIVEYLNDDNSISADLVIKNLGEQPMGRAWRLYFSLGLSPAATETRVARTLLDGRYGYLHAGQAWPDLGPGESINIAIENWLLNGMPLRARQGFHLSVHTRGRQRLLGTPVLNEPVLVELDRLQNPWIRALSPSADVQPQTAANIYTKNTRANVNDAAFTTICCGP